jgi:2-polyprenyl-6-methoxyphenol hydroxylase-like FAD-dependent oxidoreductase
VDGRGSMARKWGGFSVKNDAAGMLIGGVLCTSMPSVSANTNHWIINPSAGQFAFLTPQNAGRTRAYAWHPKELNYRFQGMSDLPRFVEDSLTAEAPADWYAQLRPIGPLATFDGTDSWVDHPYKDGVLLLGDAPRRTIPPTVKGSVWRSEMSAFWGTC